MQLDPLDDLYTILAIEAGVGAIVFFVLLSLSLTFWRIEFHPMGWAIVTFVTVFSQSLLTFLCFVGSLPPFTNVIVTGLVVCFLLWKLSGEDLFPDCVLLTVSAYLPTVLILLVLEARLLA